MAQTAAKKRGTQPDPSKLHITETPLIAATWYKHIDWFNVFFIIGLPIFGLLSAAYTPLQTKTAIWAIAYYFMTGMGITAGWYIRGSPCSNILLTLPQVTTGYGHIDLTQPAFLSKSGSLPLAAAQL